MKKTGIKRLVDEINGLSTQETIKMSDQIEGVAVINGEDEWIGVYLTKSEYRILKALAEKGSDMERSAKLFVALAKFRNRNTHESNLASLEDILKIIETKNSNKRLLEHA